MLRDYRRAHRAIVDRKYGLAERIAGRVLEERADFGPALWIHAAASAALFDVESADEAFGHLVELPRLAEEYRLRLQALAPRLLTGAGRPDLAAKYILSGGGHIPLEPTGVAAADGEEGEGERHPEAVVSRTAKWADQPVESPRMRRLEAAARSARIRVLMELGHLERARRYLQGLADERADRRRFRLLRAELTARGGRRTAGPGEWRWSDAGPPARLVDSFYVGKFDRAIEVGRRMLEEGTSMRVVRLVALSYASTDRGRRALQVLSNRAAAVADAPDRERVRARILARLSNEEESVASVVNQFEQIAPRSTEAQVDLAAIMLWKHRIGAAETWSEAALVQAPDYPEANWMRGLVLRLRDERGAAKRYLRRSWRTTGGDGRLDLELGYVNLALQKWKRARDLFYRALLADPSSLEAIRGLGRAYHRLDPDEGRWNFQRILENYEGRASRALHAAEVLRWLAVFRGSREGKARGRSYLQRAREKAGDRAFILLEFARFYEARGDGQKAHDLYVEALEKDSTVASAHLGLARVARADGREQLMRTHLQRYLDLQPAGQHAGWARAKLKELSGRPSDD
jgi:tetratricopeptide (TPR) repeat protein